MKKFYPIFVCLFGILMMCIVASSLHSCEHKSGHTFDGAFPSMQDSVEFVQKLNAVLPALQAVDNSFDNTTGVLREQQMTRDYYSDDSLFRAMPEEVLSTVCVTLFRVKSKITVADVIHEYREYKHVYDNLDLTKAAEEIRKFKSMQEQQAKKEPPIEPLNGITSTDSSNTKQ